jgi:hypothetical protein
MVSVFDDFHFKSFYNLVKNRQVFKINNETVPLFGGVRGG